MTIVTVVGAGGNTGSRVTEVLTGAGVEVRSVGRSADRLAAAVALGARPAVGDLLDAGFLAEAMQGADAAYLMLPSEFGPVPFRRAQDELGAALVAAVAGAGVRRVVALSSVGAEVPRGTGLLECLHAQEERLRSLVGVDVLLLRPGMFFTTFVPQLPAVRADGVLVGAVDGDLPVPMVAPRDVGEVAGRALLAGDFTGVQVREVLGPRDLTHAEVAAAMGRAVGVPGARYEAVATATYVEAMVAAGVPRDFAELDAGMAEGLNAGRVRASGRTPASTTPTTVDEAFAAIVGAREPVAVG
jgi:uncharacterized protein YbjT (DUF2867 family)